MVHLSFQYVTSNTLWPFLIFQIALNQINRSKTSNLTHLLFSYGNKKWTENNWSPNAVSRSTIVERNWEKKYQVKMFTPKSRVQFVFPLSIAIGRNVRNKYRDDTVPFFIPWPFFLVSSALSLSLAFSHCIFLTNFSLFMMLPMKI